MGRNGPLPFQNAQDAPPALGADKGHSIFVRDAIEHYGAISAHERDPGKWGMGRGEVDTTAREGGNAGVGPNHADDGGINRGQHNDPEEAGSLTLALIFGSVKMADFRLGCSVSIQTESGH